MASSATVRRQDLSVRRRSVVEKSPGNDRQTRPDSAALSARHQVGLQRFHGIQGYIVEKLTGQSIPDFMHDHIFAPLKMKDTGFYVPKEKWNRFATLYGEDPSGALAPLTPLPTLGLGDYKSQPTMPSGGGGMVSTAQDYARFAQMLLNGGELDGARILSPAAVQLMSGESSGAEFAHRRIFDRPGANAPGHGLGLRLRRNLRPAHRRRNRRQGHIFLGSAPPTPGSGSIPRMTSCSLA